MGILIMYEVYVCKYDDDIVYIGQGLKGRHRHCISGKSHVYELNEIFFSDNRNRLSVNIHTYCSDKKDAEMLEKELIQRYRPKFNSVFLNTDRQKSASKVKKFMSNMLKDVPKGSVWFYSKDGVAYKEALQEFLDFHLYEDFMKDGFELRGRNFYARFNFKRLENIARYPYDPNSNSWKNVFKRNLAKYSGYRVS